MIFFKRGVEINGLDKSMLDVLRFANDFMETNGKYLVITSAMDGVHKKGSLHYMGRALDMRIRHLVNHQKDDFQTFMKTSLSHEYDIIMEEDHLHVEFDPKKEKLNEEINSIPVIS